MSSLPLIFAIQVAFVLALGWQISPRAVAALMIPIVAFGIWGALSSWAAQSGIYDDPEFLALLPGLWLPAVPFLLFTLCLALPGVRHAVAAIIESTPHHWLVAIQILRIAALGTLVKTLTGEFPVHVELAIGLTDLAFGLSAIWVFFQSRRGKLHPDALAIWHAVGAAIILIPANIALQTGLPGPLQVFHDQPTAEVMLDWPMVLAPTLVVPVFLIFNILGAVAAWRNRSIPKEAIK